MSKHTIQEEFLSLYDFLGRAAGKDLGAQVYVAAERGSIAYLERSISNPSFRGKVKLYPKSFLVGYFSHQSSSNQEATQESELPF
jgi:hypothetical protein